MPLYAKVTGVINGGAADTFQTGDTINGSGATNHVDVTVANTTAAAPLVAINNVGALNVRTLAAQTLNATLFEGVSTVRSTGSTNVLAVTNGAIASTYALANTVATNADGLAVGIRGGDLAGTTTAVNFSVANVGTANSAATGVASNAVNSALSTTVSGIENIVIDTTGTNLFTFAGNTGATTDSASLTITGSGNNTVTINAGGLATAATISAATATGSLNLNVGTNFSSNDTYVGTAGTADTLRATVDGVVATGVTATGFETFRIDSGASAATVVFAANPSFGTLREDAGAAAGGVRTLALGAGFSNLNLVGDGLTANAAVAKLYSGITATGGWTGAADAVAINLSNGGVAQTAIPVINDLTLNGAETLNFTISDNTANQAVTVNDITSSTLQSVTFASNGIVTQAAVNYIQTNLANANSISTVNLSGVTGVGVSNVNIGDGTATSTNIIGAAAALTASAGGATFVVNVVENAADVITVTGGAGVDTLTSTLFAGNYIASMGGGADVVTLTGTANTATLTGGTGADTFTLRTLNGATISDLGVGGADVVGNILGNTVATVAANWTATGASTVAGGTLTLNAAAGTTLVDATLLAAGGVTMNANAATATTLTGSARADTINGSTLADVLNGLGGIDAIVSNGGADTITAGLLGDTITLGTGVQTVVQGTGDSVVGATGTWAAGAAGLAAAAGQTIIYAAAPDLVTGFTAGVGGDVLDLAVAIQAVTGIGVANNALGAGVNYFLSGNYNAGTFTIAANGLGADTLIIQGYAAAGATQATNASEIILLGVNSGNLVAANFA